MGKFAVGWGGAEASSPARSVLRTGSGRGARASLLAAPLREEECSPQPPYKHKLWPREPLSVLGAGEAAPCAPGDLGTPVLGAEAALRSRPRRAPGELGRVGGVRLWAWGWTFGPRPGLRGRSRGSELV